MVGFIITTQPLDLLAKKPTLQKQLPRLRNSFPSQATLIRNALLSWRGGGISLELS